MPTVGRRHFLMRSLALPVVAALCDVDQAVVDTGCKTIEAAGQKRPATYADFRKLLDDKSIDAASIATPNFHHTLQATWAVQAGKDVLVEKRVSYSMFEARQISSPRSWKARLGDADSSGQYLVPQDGGDTDHEIGNLISVANRVSRVGARR